MYGNKRIWKDVRNSLLIFLLAAALFIGCIALMSIFSGEIMRIFGFTYDSVPSVVKFFVFGALISWPCSLAAEAIPKILCYDKKIIPKWQAVIIYVILSTLATSLGLSVVDARMVGVTANRKSIGVVSFLFALCNCQPIIISRPENT